VRHLCRLRQLFEPSEEEQAFSELKSVIENRNVWDYPFGASVSKLRFLPPSKTDPNHELVLAARRAIRAVTGTDPGCGGFEASCDMTFFSNRAMIPGIILGPSDLALAHQVDEYVEEREVRLAADVYVRTVLEYL
jgi:acetylornithine deacetylase/succinyl-diaminopimelate desuccinylase-like protein